MCETAQRARKKIARTFWKKVLPSAESDKLEALGRPPGVFPGNGVASFKSFYSRGFDPTGNQGTNSGGGAQAELPSQFPGAIASHPPQFHRGRRRPGNQRR